MKNMKNVVVFCECGFTQKGIEALLQPEYDITSVQAFTECQAYIVQNAKIDLVILSFFSGREGVVIRLDALIRLYALLLRYQPSCKVLLNFGCIGAPILRFYFSYLGAFFGLIDFKWPVSTLKKIISGVMTGQVVLPKKGVSGLTVLNQRERSVLRALMMEFTAYEIACALKLSVKTVSSYKRSGLSKLGVRSIQALLLPSTVSGEAEYWRPIATLLVGGGKESDLSTRWRGGIGAEASTPIYL